jgi:hypothetical protein
VRRSAGRASLWARSQARDDVEALVEDEGLRQLRARPIELARTMRRFLNEDKMRGADRFEQRPEAVCLGLEPEGRPADDLLIAHRRRPATSSRAACSGAARAPPRRSSVKSRRTKHVQWGIERLGRAKKAV